MNHGQQAKPMLIASNKMQLISYNHAWFGYTRLALFYYLHLALFFPAVRDPSVDNQGTDIFVYFCTILVQASLLDVQCKIWIFTTTLNLFFPLTTMFPTLKSQSSCYSKTL